MCKAENLNTEKNNRKKEDFSKYVYVMISTQNQMVNYIPLKHFKFKEIYYITIRDDSKYFDNKRWDKNLQEVLKEAGYNVNIVEHKKNKTVISFGQQEVSDISTIKTRLMYFVKNLGDKNKIFWNITGGQRPFILTINQLIIENSRNEDIVCYLEGNYNQMVLLKNHKKVAIGIIDDYSLDDLNIETALKLMGFMIKNTKTSHRNLVKDKNINKNEMDFYLKFLKKYNADEELRENLILLNKDLNGRKKVDKEKIKKAIQESIKDLNPPQNFDEELNRNMAFGYILEKLAGYKILEIAKDKIADITFGEKIISNNKDRDNDTDNKYNNNDSNNKHYIIDEFDILLLTKNGKFMVFECKSGGMSGDVAKSTKYSTYAISGVYGLPILITPLLKNEIENLDNLDKELYGYTKNSVKAAKRASLDVWGLDEIEEKLKKYIEL